VKRSPTPDYEGSHRRYNEHTTETLFEHYVGKNVTYFSWGATQMSMPCALCGHVVKGSRGAPLSVPDPEYDGVFAFDGVVCGRCRSITLNDSPTSN